ncbi:MAG: sigma-54 dependent transcriptional regulator [Desulfobulbus sp.]|jgi:two-component system C4-dicarboxylate transport response regulator DctD|uniref:sigma-54-dependent transcriptional regulator n=1 Tax=Desulfobulbus sp. TaxID=895 RepID=UPI00283BFC40|nr:sigma-54 dependent transcriptional regulator [Desulfobulbus sp.]MDR2548694.1 sigma-54 dependent transcriptional regulator [Desulfobulbus sp.]
MKNRTGALPAPEILVVDDDLYLLAAIKQTLALNGYAVQTYGNPLEALARIDENTYSAVLADIRMPEMDGLVLLERILAEDPDLPVILITGHGDISLAVEAVKKGAYHFLQKPVDEDIILATLTRAIERRQLVLENRRLEQQLTATREGRSRFYGLVGSHPAMLGLYALIETIAHESDPVLIVGETGTGKELAARALHAIGRPEAAPYVAVNMGALPAEMIESELFGHEKGAFTGAIQRKVGKFEYAGEGTLFLDEICSMPAPLQAKLLRVLEERSFTRLGGNAAIPLKARVIAATNRDLRAEIDKGSFRQDLYFRLNVLPVHLPPLRDRKEDIPLLVEAFRTEYCDGQDGEVRPCSPELIRQLMRQEWPGNVRELRNFVRRYCVLGGKEPAMAGPAAAMAGEADFCEMPWKDFMEQQERHYIERMLKRAGGQVSAAHRAMGISRKSLYDKINKYKIALNQFREEESGD